MFRFTADLQARRRLGLTATLVREDGKEGDVFSLIGPKRYDVPWRDIETQGWIAPADCTEVRVTLTDEERMAYAVAEPEERYRVAATAASKLPVVEAIVDQHQGEQVLVIGAYLDQLHELRRPPGSPADHGATTQQGARAALRRVPRRRDPHARSCPRWATSPSTCPTRPWPIQVSGTFGSRQEEAQRLGRILRPKEDGRQAHFYTVVSRDTIDTEYAAHRQRFLAEQGYAYTIIDASTLA